MRFAFVLSGLIAACCVATHLVEGAVLFGSYTPNVATAAAFNEWLAFKNQSVGIVELGWEPPTSVPQQLVYVQAVWNSGAVPVLTWMPYPYANWTSPTPNDDVVNGVYDEYINTFYTALASFLSGSDGQLGTDDDRRAYLRFAPQPNGDWFPWSPYCPSCASTGQHIDQSVASYVAMFQYVVGIARGKYALTADTLQVMWCVNDIDVSGPFEEYYPGDGFVDWTSVVGFNFGNTLPGNQWTNPAELFEPPLARLRTLASTKPVGLVTVASTSSPKGVVGKGRWLARLFEFIAARLGAVHMVAFHNADGQTDFAVFGGANGDATYKGLNVYSEVQDGLQSNGWIVGSDAANPRLISQAAFSGSNSTPTMPPGPTSPPPPPTTAAPPNPNCPCDTPATRDGLRKLYDATNGDGWTNRYQWNTGASLCSWYGVGCPASNPYLALTLDQNNLVGTLPDYADASQEFMSLLQYVDLDNNVISGTLPDAWSNMNNLQSLFLYTNQFTGTIPSSWALLGNITNLQLDINKLQGTLPSWISQLSNLEYLSLDNNYLTGPMPTSWCSLVMLDGVTLCDGQDNPETNKFCGPDPACWVANDALSTAYSNCLVGGKPLPYC